MDAGALIAGEGDDANKAHHFKTAAANWGKAADDVSHAKHDFNQAESATNKAGDASVSEVEQGYKGRAADRERR